MAVKSGINGAVYYNEALTDTSTTGNIYFSTGKTIISSGNTINFATEGYESGMLVTVSGCTTSTGNNRIFTISAVSSGQLTVSEAVIAAAPEGAEVVFTEADPGIEMCGFYNWTVNYKVDLLDATAFDTSSGGRSYIANITDWAATADKYFLSTGNTVDDWLGETVKVRFFLNYVASPTTGSPSQYYEGDTIVTGIDQGTPVDALITQNISFQGKGALTLTTKTTAWNA